MSAHVGKQSKCISPNTMGYPVYGKQILRALNRIGRADKIVADGVHVLCDQQTCEKILNP